ncbi:TlpA disulfide reductase family protein [Pseudofulvibacter geojedonensis]|uniref:TlpA disulfide reductase family protein n=1 Tax=Pseudofulvibacter geojedonensis TaxID=1123758 RepID=A0ABW3I557_9FLAO
MKVYQYFILLTLIIACKNRGDKSIKNQEIISVNYEELEPFLNKVSDTTYVVNFWATWCKPCVEELPFFEELNKKYASDKVKVLLVSLDMPKQLETRLKPFVKENKLKSQVILLNDPNQNNWIPKIDSHWDGAIPATLIYNKNRRMFYAKSFTYSELEKITKQFIP